MTARYRCSDSSIPIRRSGRVCVRRDLSQTRCFALGRERESRRSFAKAGNARCQHHSNRNVRQQSDAHRPRFILAIYGRRSECGLGGARRHRGARPFETADVAMTIKQRLFGPFTRALGALCQSLITERRDDGEALARWEDDGGTDAAIPPHAAAVWRGKSIVKIHPVPATLRT